jgi:glucose uptake protein
MILPTTFFAALLLFLLSMLCSGAWPNTYKMAGAKWRFELYYVTYSFGAVLAASIAALTLGTFGTELSFIDNLAVTGKRQIAFGLAAGGLFNLGNMLFMASVSMAGISVAFPLAVGLALAIGILWEQVAKPQANTTLLFAGVALVVLAIAFTSMAYSQYTRTQLQDLGKKVKSPVKVIVVSLISGLLMGAISPFVALAKAGDIGLGPYTLAFCISLGIFLSTPVFSIYFMNLPVHGKPVEFGEFFKGTARQHLLGVLGGMLWSASAIAGFTAASAPLRVETSAALSSAMGPAAILAGTLCGLLFWNEFQDAQGKARTWLAAMLLCLAAGGTLVTIARFTMR